MTGKVVNLARVRKARAKTARAATADANRARFGRTKAEREAQTVMTERRDALLDAARIER